MEKILECPIKLGLIYHFLMQSNKSLVMPNSLRTLHQEKKDKCAQEGFSSH